MKLFRRQPRRDLRLVVGLGNPGERYAGSRHNIGFMAVDHWARRHRLSLTRRRPWALVGEGDVAIEGASLRVLVAKPRRFMNESGDAVVELVRRHQIDLEHLIIVCDDLDLPVGRLRLRERGSSGGHRGLASIMQRLGTEEFPRLRIGIGRPEGAGADPVDYVLSGFRPAEREVVEEALARASDALDWVVARGTASAMNRFNPA